MISYNAALHFIGSGVKHTTSNNAKAVGSDTQVADADAPSSTCTVAISCWCLGTIHLANYDCEMVGHCGFVNLEANGGRRLFGEFTCGLRVQVQAICMLGIEVGETCVRLITVDPC